MQIGILHETLTIETDLLEFFPTHGQQGRDF